MYWSEKIVHYDFEIIKIIKTFTNKKTITTFVQK